MRSTGHPRPQPFRLLRSEASCGPAAIIDLLVEFAPERAPGLVGIAKLEIEPGSKMLEGITEGWPGILSNLKSLLETNQTLSLSSDGPRRTPSGRPHLCGLRTGGSSPPQLPLPSVRRDVNAAGPG